MKKSLNAILVIVLSFVGANALASQIDLTVKRVVIESSSTGSGSNANGEGGVRNMITREK